MYRWIHQLQTAFTGEKNALSIIFFSSKIIQSLCGTVVKDLISFVGDSEGVSSNPVKAILYNLVLFFSL